MSYGIRKDFYQSKAWKTVRKNIWIKQNCLCANCGKPVYVDGISSYIPKYKRRIGIVHHIEHLNDSNVYDDNITINENNLIGICIDCHNLIHEDDINNKWLNYSRGTRKEYMFDKEGNITPKDIKGG